MKWAYLIVTLAGGLIPVVRLYLRFIGSPNYVGAQVDPVLFLRSAALAFATIPVFAGLAVLGLAAVHVTAVLVARRLRRRGKRPAEGEQFSPDTSWVSHRRRPSDAAGGPAAGAADAPSEST